MKLEYKELVLSNYTPRHILRTLIQNGISCDCKDGVCEYVRFEVPDYLDVLDIKYAHYYWANVLSLMWQAQARLTGGVLSLYPNGLSDEEILHSNASIIESHTGLPQVSWCVILEYSMPAPVLSSHVHKLGFRLSPREPFYVTHQNLFSGLLHETFPVDPWVSEKEKVLDEYSSAIMLQIPLTHIQMLEFQLLSMYLPDVDDILGRFLP